MSPHIQIDRSKIEAFCRKWKIAELALFGSVLRDDFRGDSDVDVLVTFGPGGGIGLETRVQMLDELREMFGRDVDLIVKDALRNPFRRLSILRSREVVYAA